MIIQGIAWYAKVVGKPQKAYDKTKTEWTIDLSIDEETQKKLKAEGLGPKIKNKGDDRGFFITFKRPGTTKEGHPSKPIRIVDNKAKPWGDALIGNGSLVKISFLINEGTYNDKPWKKPGILGIQVVKLVPYEGKSDFDAIEGEEDNDSEDNWESAED